MGDHADRISEDGQAHDLTEGDDFVCPYCARAMVRRKNEYGFWWSCSGFPDCDAKVGAHPDGTPLGTPARAELRHWRRAAHEVFDPLWRKAKDNPEPPMSRGQAYDWLGRQTGIRHIAEQDIDGCYAVIRAVFNRTRA